jgi:hypothetical protein
LCVGARATPGSGVKLYYAQIQKYLDLAWLLSEKKNDQNQKYPLFSVQGCGIIFLVRQKLTLT